MLSRISVSIVSLAFCATASSSQEHFIYADVYTKDDQTISGFIRWDDEEVLWTDHFNGQKTQNAGVTHLADEDRAYLAKRMPERLVSWAEVARMLRKNNDYADYAKPHDFIAQFGDLRKITIKEGYAIAVTLRNGEVVDLLGGSNDIGTEVNVWPNSEGKRVVEWSDIQTVTFREAPKDEEAPFFGALFGTVETTIGEFSGQVQWDHDERIGIDVLDGEANGEELEIPFSDITSIAKEGRGSLVTLKSGVSHFMTGTNDVEPDNRGIIVTVPGTGRVDVSWKLFKRVTFVQPSELLGYAEFADTKALLGQVRTKKGDKLSGRLIFNLDRVFDAEMLSGESGDLEYTIPFREIKRISPRDTLSARVSLKSGGGFSLAYSNAVTDKNDGVIVLDTAGAPSFVPWKSMEYLEID